MADVYLGELEQIVLLAVLRLGDQAYAVPVLEQIERQTGRQVARGALYTALDRLEAKGCLRSRLGEPLAERGGRRAPAAGGGARRGGGGPPPLLHCHPVGHSRAEGVEVVTAPLVERTGIDPVTAPLRVVEQLLLLGVRNPEEREMILGDLEEEA